MTTDEKMIEAMARKLSNWKAAFWCDLDEHEKQECLGMSKIMLEAIKPTITQDLKEAVALLKAWTRSEWKDFIQENPSPLMHNTKKWLEGVEDNDKV